MVRGILAISKARMQYLVTLNPTLCCWYETKSPDEHAPVLDLRATIGLRDIL